MPTEDLSSSALEVSKLRFQYVAQGIMSDEIEMNSDLLSKRKLLGVVCHIDSCWSACANSTFLPKKPDSNWAKRGYYK